MGDVIRKKLFINEAISMIFTVFLMGHLLFVAYYHISYTADERDVRVQMNRFLVALRQEWKEDTVDVESLPMADFPYCIFDIDGRVLYTTMDDYSQAEIADLSTIGSSRYYSTPVVNEDQVKGMLLVDPSKERQKKLLTVFGMEAAPAFVWLLLIFVMRLRIGRMMKKDIWEPIGELHQSTRHILSGDLDAGVSYDYSGEIGTLCHDFEKMRDDIRDREMCQQRTSEKERALYASISHDLKTPIAIITGYLEQILYDVVTTPEKIHETAEHALNKAKLLNKLTEDILEHSKAQMNQLSIHKQEVFADSFFGNLMNEYKQEAMQQHYQFTYDTPPKVLIDIDTDRIAQVVQNIVSNAVKYGGEKLSIHVSFEILNPGYEDKILIVSIRDNGKGIEATDLPFVFDLFYRGNKARTQNIPGSGLGLNISRYIVEQHDGRIECDSVVGAGTTVSFSIPIP
ncbi:MAG: HAMP domain-containing sensor histidine kinase [bacterium]|nr:HAMP domain-containing sensor histidine kinase [bacterium]